MYAYTQDVPIRAELYRRVVAELGPEPVPGQLLHLCLERPDGTLFYLDVWQDEASCDRAFDERIHPAVDRAFGGNRPSAEPAVHPCVVLDAQGVWAPVLSG